MTLEKDKKTRAEAFRKQVQDAEARIMKKIKARAAKLAKDPELLKQMEAEIHGKLKK